MPSHPDARTRFLPNPAAAFLAQLNDIPGSADFSALSYAMAAVLPRTRWPEEEFQERLISALSAPDNLAIIERELRQQKAGIFSSFVLKLNDVDGNPVNFLVLARPLLSGGHDSAEKILISSALTNPTTELEPLLSPLTGNWHEKTRLLNLLDILPAYVVMVDQYHRIRFENKISRQLFGPGRGKPCYEVLRGQSAPCDSCPPLSVISSQSVSISEWASNSLNNAFRVHSYPFVDPDGVRVVLKIGINITAGVRAQHALDLSEQRYRSITDNLTIGVALLDSRLTVVTMNPRFQEWFRPVSTAGAGTGASICEIMQQSCEDGPKGCDACGFKSCLEKRETREHEFSMLTANGESRSFRQIVCPILTRKKEVRGALLMLEDITERQQLAAKVQQLQRLEAMGSLAGGIAHEINQPLSALHLYASGLQMLLEQGEDLAPARLLERLGLILSQAEKIREIINHMRALVMQEGESAALPTSPAQAVAGALALVGAQIAAHDIKVHADLPDDLPLVLAKPVQLEQVLINLLLNAMHALDTVDNPRKSIRIEAGQVTGNGFFLRVRDNGPGLRGLEDKIFDPFFTTREAHQGMGLGLAIVHAFARSWGGDVQARGNGAKPGATFTLSLRIAEPEQ